MSGPLTGLRFIEIGHMLAGPYCGLLLADLGAEIIKIEPPGGDIARRVSPHTIGQHNAYFASLNRSKKSIVLDLASDEGRQALGELCAHAHALITNLRPSAIHKLGLTYTALRQFNPRLVCVALTGYGLNSIYAERPAYDYVIQALTGVMALTGEPDAPPTKTGYSAVDNSSGMMAALGLLAKIVEGQGGQVDVSMYDVMLSQLNYLAGASLNTGEAQKRYRHSSHPYIVPAQLFQSADGWLMLFITHDDFWRRFCTELDCLEWLTDARFATMARRGENRELVIDAIAARLRGATSEHWVQRLAPLGIVVAAVQTLEQSLAGELARDRAMVVELAGDGPTIRAIGSPLKMDGLSPEYGAPPLLGEHNALLASLRAR